MNSIRNRPGILLVAVSLLFLLSACLPVKPTVDPAMVTEQLNAALSKYDQLTLGMSHAEVTALLGSEGRDVGTSSDDPGAPVVPAGTLKYYKVNGFEIRTMFLQDRLIIKGFAWEDYTDYPKSDAMTTKDKFDLVTIGMTYAEVTQILGSPGLIFTRTDDSKPGLSITGSGLDVNVQTYSTAIRWETYSWWTEETAKKSLGRGMQITFTDGIATMKYFEGQAVTGE